MSTAIMLYLASYLVFGMIALILFDMATKRIRSKLGDAVTETQSKLAKGNALEPSGTYVTPKIAKVLLLGVMWLFWPMVFVGALTDKTTGGQKHRGKKQETARGESSKKERPAQ